MEAAGSPCSAPHGPAAARLLQCPEPVKRSGSWLQIPCNTESKVQALFARTSPWHSQQQLFLTYAKVSVHIAKQTHSWWLQICSCAFSHLPGIITCHEKTCLCCSHLVKEVDLGDRVACISGVLHQQSYQSDKGIQCVKALSPDQCWAVRLISQGTITQVHAHFRAQAEEPSDEVICFQYTLLVHLRKHESTLNFLLTDP